eukprot:6173791-Pleurochrysis_carterae.AAC.1
MASSEAAGSLPCRPCRRNHLEDLVAPSALAQVTCETVGARVAARVHNAGQFVHSDHIVSQWKDLGPNERPFLACRARTARGRAGSDVQPSSARVRCAIRLNRKLRVSRISDNYAAFSRSYIPNSSYYSISDGDL